MSQPTSHSFLYRYRYMYSSVDSKDSLIDVCNIYIQQMIIWEECGINRWVEFYMVYKVCS
jgi:hypothetical protein